MGKKPKPRYEDEELAERFNAARRACNDEWARRTNVQRGGYFCFGPVDGPCGTCHENKAGAVNCLMRFRVNKGGGYSDREVWKAADGEQANLTNVWIPGTFSKRGAFNGDRPEVAA